jgi:hypothetical protein
VARQFNMITTCCFALAAWFAAGSSARPQATAAAPQPGPSAFERHLRGARYELHIENGRFTGAAAAILAAAIADSKYVLVGEDHLTREIPQFVAVVCDLMAPHGLSTMVVEASPEAAKFVSSLLGQPDRLARMATLLHEHPDSVAFLNMRQENDLVAQCAQAAHNPNFQLWGLDQPFIGSAGWLLDQMLAAHPGPRARTLLTHLRDEERQAAARAEETGDPSKLFLLSVSDSDLTQAAAVLQQEGEGSADALLSEWVEGREAYLKSFQGHAADSNNQRARFLKRNFRQDQEAAGGDRKQRVLVKFGNSHLYKGLNELHQRDLGNYISEIADSQGSTSLHICVLGAKGTHERYGGYDRPGKLEAFTLDGEGFYPWLKPAVDDQIPNAWTLYDLRMLRFQELGSVDPEMDRLIYGYDLLVLAPELTPADPIR